MITPFTRVTVSLVIYVSTSNLHSSLNISCGFVVQRLQLSCLALTFRLYSAQFVRHCGRYDSWCIVDSNHITTILIVILSVGINQHGSNLVIS